MSAPPSSLYGCTILHYYPAQQNADLAIDWGDVYEHESRQPERRFSHRVRGACDCPSFLRDVRRPEDHHPRGDGEGARMDQPARVAAHHGRRPEGRTAGAV